MFSFQLDEDDVHANRFHAFCYRRLADQLLSTLKEWRIIQRVNTICFVEICRYHAVIFIDEVGRYEKHPGEIGSGPRRDGRILVVAMFS